MSTVLPITFADKINSAEILAIMQKLPLNTYLPAEQINLFKNAINELHDRSLANPTFKGSIDLSTATPTVPGVYTPTVSGTYTNFGGLVVDLSLGYITITFDGTTYKKITNTIDLNNYASKTDISKKSNLVPGKNLYNKATNTLNSYCNTSGAIITDTGYQLSDYIEIGSAAAYNITRMTFVNYFNSSKVFISGISGIFSGTRTTPAGTAYMRFADQNGQMTGSNQLELGTIPTLYEAYNLKIPLSEVANLPTSKIYDIQSQLPLLGFPKLAIGKNLYNKTTNTLNTYCDSSGALISQSGYQMSDYIAIGSNIAYNITRMSFVNYFNSNKILISGINGIFTGTRTTPVGTAFMRFADSDSQMTGNNQLELGTTGTAYTAYSEKFSPDVIPNLNTPAVVTITAARYGTADFVGRRAIQDAIDSITDASATKKYVVKVLPGVYEAISSAQFDKTSPGNCFIQGKNYVDVIGFNRDSVVITGILPNNLGGSFAYSSYQTVYWHCNSNLENVTIIGENLRYPIHIDAGQLGLKDVSQNIKNVIIRHNGNTVDALTNWQSVTPLGLGTSDGQLLTLSDVILESNKRSLYIHNNLNFNLASTYHLKRCEIRSNSEFDLAVIKIESLGSGVNDKLILEECIIDSGFIRYQSTPWIPTELEKQKADHAEIELIAPSLEPRAFDNSLLTGKGLKITSKSTGSNSKVRFDQTSSAFNLIIGNSLSTYEFQNKYFRKEIYGYQYFDGGNALAGYAIGGLDIGNTGVSLNQNVYITPLGKRLGDCSTVNKTLTLTIDGTSYNIVFNKNYNGTSSSVLPNYTNADIITEITNVIGSVATVEEYVVGQDYYPQFRGNCFKYNADTAEILSGMGVIFITPNSIRKALNSDNRIDGICINDCIVGGKARVITRGEFYTSNKTQRFKIKEVSSATRNIGTELGISAVTAGVFDIAATPKLLIVKATDVVTIKN